MVVARGETLPLGVGLNWWVWQARPGVLGFLGKRASHEWPDRLHRISASVWAATGRCGLWWACGGQQLFQVLGKNTFSLLGPLQLTRTLLHATRGPHAKDTTRWTGEAALRGEWRHNCHRVELSNLVGNLGCLAALWLPVNPGRCSKQVCAALRKAVVRVCSVQLWASSRPSSPSRLSQSRRCVALRPNTFHSVGLQLFDVPHLLLLLASGCHVASRLAGQSAWAGPKVDKETKYGNGGLKPPLS